MDGEEFRPWPALPKECLEVIMRCAGPQAAACLSSTCRGWRNDLADEFLWQFWHDLPLLRYHSWRSSYATYARSLRAWLVGQQQAAAVVPCAHERWVTSLDLSPGHVLSGSMDANVKYWDRSRPGAWVHYLRGHTGPVSSVRLAYDGGGGTTSSYGRAYSGSRDGTLRCWDLATGVCVRACTLEGGRQWVNALAVWRDHHQQQQQQEQLMASAASPPLRAPHWGGSGGFVGAGAVYETGHAQAMGYREYGDVTASGTAASSAASANPHVVVCGTSIGQLCLYDVRQPGLAQRILAGEPHGAVYGLAVYGDALAAACASGCVTVWDMRAGSVRHKLDHRSACTCVAMYEHTLVAGDLEGGVYLWSTAPGEARIRGVLAPVGSPRGGGGGGGGGAGAAGRGGTVAASQRAPSTAVSEAVNGSCGSGGDGTALSAGETCRTTDTSRLPHWAAYRKQGWRRGSCSSSRSSSSSSSDNEGEGGGAGRAAQKGVGASDAAAVVAELEALSYKYDTAPWPWPFRRRAAPLTAGLNLGSPWLRSPPRCRSGPGSRSRSGPAVSTPRTPTSGGSGGGSGAGEAGGIAPTTARQAYDEAASPGSLPPSSLPPPPPARLRATMRHSEWVRDVALVGPRLVLSCSKDGLVCLSRADTMQVVAAWDVAAAGAAGGVTRSGGEGQAGSAAAAAAAATAAATAAAGGGGGRQMPNQVHAMAADEWGFVAGCQDASLRLWTFAPGGVVPEVYSDSRR